MLEKGILIFTVLRFTEKRESSKLLKNERIFSFFTEPEANPLKIFSFIVVQPSFMIFFPFMCEMTFQFWTILLNKTNIKKPRNFRKAESRRVWWIYSAERLAEHKSLLSCWPSLSGRSHWQQKRSQPPQRAEPDALKTDSEKKCQNEATRQKCVKTKRNFQTEKF